MSKLIKIDIFIIKNPVIFFSLIFFSFLICGLLIILQHSIGIIIVIAEENLTISIQNYTNSIQGTDFL